jgi:GLPGLI family protein
MKRFRWIGFCWMLLSNSFSFAQKTISEGTIVYNIVIQTGNKEPQMADALDGAVTTVSIKGGMTRTDMVSALGSETTLHDAKTGNATILKEYSGQKLMYSLTKENWASKNKKYEGIIFKFGDETTTIAGYRCKKATAILKDGSSFWVYYCPDLVVLNKDYDEAFKTLPGLALQYEYLFGKLTFKYTVAKIDFNPIPLSKFEIPKSGYRIMEYSETKKGDTM